MSDESTICYCLLAMQAPENQAQVVLYVLWENRSEVTDCTYKSNATWIKTVTVAWALCYCAGRAFSLCTSQKQHPENWCD